MQILDDWLLTPHRSAIHLPSSTAVIADLHLGYDAVRRQTGEAVPAFSIAGSLAALALLAAEHGIRRLAIAGDLCEDGRCADPVRAWLDGLARCRIELIGIVPGNHDRGGVLTDFHLPIFPDGLTLGRWLVIHGDAPRRGRIVQGHCHPCFRGPGGSAPCFLVGRQRIILPAFSDDPAGVNVLAQPAWRAYRCWVIAGAKVLDFGAVDRIVAGKRGARFTDSR